MTLHDFIRERFFQNGFSTEDTIACLLPLIKQVAAAHEEGMVAPLQGLEKLKVEAGRAYFHDSDRVPIQLQPARIQRLQQNGEGPVELVTLVEDGGQPSVPVGLDPGSYENSGTPEGPRKPVYLPGFVCWEQSLEHHDPLTDIFCLGQILAAVVLRLDFHERSQLEAFVRHRSNLFAINPDIHPVVARAIVRMTELIRDRRAQELPLLVKVLENYRQQEIETSVEPSDIEGFESRDLKGKQQVLLDRLQKRLFELSRRNRLLSFRPTTKSVNLTQASVPLSFDYQNIRDDQVLICDRDLQQQIANGKSLSLNERLDFAEAIYLPSLLNKILRETRRDMAEYGFVQLRLVLCMLNWFNLKEQPHESYCSPLILVPVMLKKKRGVRDSYTLEPVSQDAEVNPVVRYLFKQLYDIRLPETIDLESADVDSLFDFIRDSIARSEPAVEFTKIDRPKIRVLHAKARSRLERYQRNARISGRGVRSWRDLDYSYDPANFHPLGIQMYSAFVRPSETRNDAIRHSLPDLRQFITDLEEDHATSIASSSQEGTAARSADSESRSKTSDKKETASHSGRKRAKTEADENGNPYNWSFDLCNVTLANFKYQKMSLVRDYEVLVADNPPNEAFEAVFSLVPRAVDRIVPDAPPLADRFDVVPCDPTQATSIAQARLGESYIVQGPPGTGKSQTITNLIADYVARGKRILFVCEKRAAIDVVFARLRQRGLGALCCLIHDSQADKKSFVMDLKDTYEGFLKAKSKRKRAAKNRDSKVDQVEAALKPLKQFSATMQDSRLAGVPTSHLIERAIELTGECPELDELQKESLPSWRIWNEARADIETFVETLGRQQPDGILARHPLRNLRSDLADASHPVRTVTDLLKDSGERLSSLIQTLEDCRLLTPEMTLAHIAHLVEHCVGIEPLCQPDNLALLDAKSGPSADLDRERKQLSEKQNVFQEALEVNAAWRQKIEPRDLPAVIDSATALTKKWFPILRPAWWRLRKVMNTRYDFASHPIRPGWIRVLSALQDEYVAGGAVETQENQIAKIFQLAGDTESLLRLIEKTRAESDDYEEWKRQIHNRLIKDSSGAGIISTVAQLAPDVGQLRSGLDQLLHAYADLTPEQLQCELNEIGDAVDQLPDYLICLQQMVRIPDEVQSVLRQMNLSPSQIEAASVMRSVQMTEREDPLFRSFDQHSRTKQIHRLEESHNQWMDTNADFVHEQTRNRFLEHVRKASEKSAAGPDVEQFRKSYIQGRRVLEHEFGKQMRYKSIRDLVSGDSGLVVRDLKPIWLMSPLSVSDTLPLRDNDFDVVIFDEASQITLEAAIPTLFRSVQAIVVGDEQQLPPTDFFSSRRDREEDEEITFEHDGEMVSYDLESNSLLNHAARNLSSTMLGWHYRSRDEALISFSNWAFYNGRLLTIPEENVVADNKPPLVADSSDSASGNLDSLFDRPISFHQIQHGVYLQRKNRHEAEYIARMICDLLKRKNDRTIGVIAFSEAQQEEIESAIDRLARDDADFAALLEAELVREDDGQFVGLLVKNLENIQGDERDIIILSVCYGPDDTGRMIMNFGPINKSGGEKRLNVAFSRAKHHMAIVSTITYSSITNEYNVGANCLRNYLRYAQASSSGDATGATDVLRNLSPGTESDSPEFSVPAVLHCIADRLTALDWIVDFNIGHSGFRCDIGVRREGDTKYRLGILVDAGDYYEADVELMDRELFRPRLLKIFGWDTCQILIKDWLGDPEQIVEQIVGLCEDQESVGGEASG